MADTTGRQTDAEAKSGILATGEEERAANGNSARLTRVQILDRHEAGILDSWSWEAWLWRDPAGSFSACLELVLWVDDPEAEPQQYQLDQFHSGGELYAFLSEAWSNDHGAEDSLTPADWEDIAAAVSALDQDLSIQLQQAVIADRDEYEGPIPQTALGRCVSGATWSRGQQPGGGGAMWATIARTLAARHAIEHYARRHLENHGRLPAGSHHVQVKFGPVGTDADCTPPAGASGAAGFDAMVCFPQPD